jgi:hypothetical protein
MKLAVKINIKVIKLFLRLIKHNAVKYKEVTLNIL